MCWLVLLLLSGECVVVMMVRYECIHPFSFVRILTNVLIRTSTSMSQNMTMSLSAMQLRGRIRPCLVSSNIGGYSCRSLKAHSTRHHLYSAWFSIARHANSTQRLDTPTRISGLRL